MKTPSWTAFVLTIAMLFGSTAFGQDQAWNKCSNIEKATENHQRLKELFKYSKLVKPPRQQVTDNRLICPPSVDEETAERIDISPLNLTQEAVNEIRNELMERARIDDFSQAYLADRENEEGGLSVGCMTSDGDETLPIFVKIKTYFILGSDFFGLGASLSTEIASSDDYGNITRIDWNPYIDPENEELVFGIPGTNLFDMRQILANYTGRKCAFPAITLAISQICEFFYDDVATGSDSGASPYFDSFPRDLLNNNDFGSYSTILAGHSLGGQAVQHVAANPPDTCSFSQVVSRQTFRAYAFASTRNRPECTSASNCAQDVQSSDESGQSMLESYLIHGDEILDRLELGNGQIGMVTTYRPNALVDLSSRHQIAETQDSICACLKGNGSFSRRFAPEY